MTAVNVLANGTIRAAGLILLSKGHKVADLDLDALTTALKATLKANLDRVMAEWKDATEANMNELWLKELMNAQCNTLALETLEGLGWN